MAEAILPVELSTFKHFQYFGKEIAQEDKIYQFLHQPSEDFSSPILLLLIRIGHIRNNKNLPGYFRAK